MEKAPGRRINCGPIQARKPSAHTWPRLRHAMVASLLLAMVLLVGCGLFRREARPTPTPTTVGGQPGGQPGTVVAPETSVPGQTNTPVVGPTALIPSGGSSIKLGSGLQPQDLTKMCSLMQQYSSHYSWITIAWQAIEPAQGRFDYSTIDRWVNGFQSCGQEVAAHVISNATWAVEPVPAGGQTNPRHPPAMPAKNQQDYYNFMFNLAQHYRGKIARYSVENEAHSDQNWGSTPEAYIQHLQTAYQAVHAADPNAIVEDAGMSFQGLGYLTANWLMSQGRVQDAINLANSYDVNYHPSGKIPHITSAAQLSTALNPPAIQYLVKWENLLFQNNRYYDRLQLHYYGPWEDLPFVMEYVRSGLAANGASKSFDFLEGGYAYTGAPGSGFNEQQQATDIVKLFSVAFGEGGDRFVYFLFDDYALSEGLVGLVSNQGSPRPAATSFKVTSDKLTGATNGQRLSLGANVWGYQFTRAGKNVFVVWSTSSGTAQLPFSGAATVTDIQGNVSETSSNTVTVGTSPIFVEP